MNILFTTFSLKKWREFLPVYRDPMSLHPNHYYNINVYLSFQSNRQRKLIVGNGIVRTTHACGKEATLLSLL